MAHVTSLTCVVMEMRPGGSSYSAETTMAPNLQEKAGREMSQKEEGGNRPAASELEP